MVTVEKIIAELKVGGYLDAAEYIERQFATINRTAEFGYMEAFIIEGDFSDERYRAQRRADRMVWCCSLVRRGRDRRRRAERHHAHRGAG